ncbi:MAG: translation initiation factor IF-2 [Parcubacteria group bacterium]|nr:translation initiation factor IF-2 [Parcubacteria group bacterium]
MNISELARKLNATPEELKANLSSLGFDFGARAIQVPDHLADRIAKKWQQFKKLKELREKVAKAAIESQSVVSETAPQEQTIINIPDTIRVFELAEKLNMSLPKIMAELMHMNIFVSLNETVDFDVAQRIAQKFNYTVAKGEIDVKQSLKEKMGLITKDKEKKFVRPPIVVVMGHVDHGKTTLLDTIRKTEVAAGEAGAITQHIGAYQVEFDPIDANDIKDIGDLSLLKRKITFIDTPGHEAFSEMRSRGGSVADIAILVIACDDKIQPATLEAIKIIHQENIPFIVALNKIDKPTADQERIKKELSDMNLVPEEWSGTVVCHPISAKTGQGVRELLEMILLMADLEKEKFLTTTEGDAIGTIIESHISKGEGAVATVIFFSGTLMPSGSFVTNSTYGKIRVMKNFKGETIARALPSDCVQIVGWKEAPRVGEIFETMSDQKALRKKMKEIDAVRVKTAFRAAQSQEGKKKIATLSLIVRADVVGSQEALASSFKDIEREAIIMLNEPFQLLVISNKLGMINEADVDLAKNANALIVGFNVTMNSNAAKLAGDCKITVIVSKIIYEIIDAVRLEVEKLKKPIFIEKAIGKLKILKVFKKNGTQKIVGGAVIDGTIEPKIKIRLWRNDSPLAEGKITELQVGKQSAQVAHIGQECGLSISIDEDIQADDMIEGIKEEEKK